MDRDELNVSFREWLDEQGFSLADEVLQAMAMVSAQCGASFSSALVMLYATAHAQNQPIDVLAAQVVVEAVRFDDRPALAASSKAVRK